MQLNGRKLPELFAGGGATDWVQEVQAGHGGGAAGAGEAAAGEALPGESLPHHAGGQTLPPCSMLHPTLTSRTAYALGLLRGAREAEIGKVLPGKPLSHHGVVLPLLLRSIRHPSLISCASEANHGGNV